MAYDSKKTKKVTKPIAVGGVKPQEYIGGEQPCEIRTYQK